MTLYDLTIAPKGIHGRPAAALSPSDFIPLQKEVKAAAQKDHPLSDEPDDLGRRLYLMDMEISARSKSVTFVWTLADPRAAAQMYLDRRNSKLRQAQKNDDEDVAISSHLVLDFDVNDGVNRYPLGLEDHEGISRTRAQHLLQQLMQSYTGPVSAILQEGVEKNGEPRVYMDSHPGRVIRHTALKPMEIELIKRIPKRQLSAGSAAMYYEASERRVLKLARKGTAEELRSQLVGYVKSLMKANPEHQIRIRWRDPDGRDTANEVTKVDPVDRPERLLERALTRTVHLNGFRGLPDATSEVIPRLANRMLEAIRSTIQEDRRRK